MYYTVCKHKQQRITKSQNKVNEECKFRPSACDCANTLNFLTHSKTGQAHSMNKGHRTSMSFIEKNGKISGELRQKKKKKGEARKRISHVTKYCAKLSSNGMQVINASKDTKKKNTTFCSSNMRCYCFIPRTLQ